MCGIWAWSGKDIKSWTPLTRYKFLTLGMEMDSRGGDGCGIAFDNCVRKSEEIKRFDDFWRKKDRVPHVLVNPSIMGHDRKASVGAKTYNNTQPIFFEGTKEQPICSILSHNGTLYNHLELIKKHNAHVGYEDQLATMSDSQMLTLLIERVGWSIFNEYIGTASIVYMHADEPGVMYVYHGASKSSTHVVNDSEERPLYAGAESSGIWFCSTRSALEKIIADKTMIIEVPFNTVFKVAGTTMTEVFTVDRSKALQYDWQTVNAKTRVMSATQTSLKNFGSSGEDVDYEDAPTYSGPHYWDNDGNLKAVKDRRPLIPKPLPFSEMVASKPVSSGCYWKSGLMYGMEDVPLHGKVWICNDGKLSNNTAQEGHCFYFWEGNMLKDRDNFISAYKMKRLSPDRTDFNIYMECAENHFAHPYIIPKKYNGDPDVLFAPFTMKLFQGIIDPIFSTRRIQFSNGRTVWVANNNPYRSLTHFLKHADPYPADCDKEIAEFEESLAKANEPEEEKIIRYECPECKSIGWVGVDICPVCNGSTYVSREYIDRMLEDRELIEKHMSVVAEEAQISRAIYTLVEDGIELLEEPEEAEQSVHVLNQLKMIKLILSDGRYNSNVQREK